MKDLFKTALGAAIILLVILLSINVLFPNEDPSIKNTLDAEPNNIASNDSNKTQQDNKNTTSANNSSNKDLNVANIEDEFENNIEGGYGDLLEPAVEDIPEEIPSNNNDIQVGVVINNEEQSNFVRNPTTVGESPADVAKQREEQKREAEKRKQEELKNQERIAKQKKEEELRKARERKEVELAKQQELQAQKAKAEKEALERARIEAEKKKQNELASTMQKGDYIASGHYLQVGAFSSIDKANQVKKNLQSARIAVSNEYRKDLMSGFGYKIESNKSNNMYIVLVGPTKTTSVLNYIKPKVDSVLGVSSKVVVR